jgi:hypothetical protein
MINLNDKLAEVLLMWSQQLVDDMVTDLKYDQITKRDQLAISIQKNNDINVSVNGVSFTLMMEDYWEYVDKGVSGWNNKRDTPFAFKSKYPSEKMIESISDWITDSGIPVKNSQGKKLTSKKVGRGLKAKGFTHASLDDVIEARERMAYGISNAILKRGKEGKLFFSDNWNEERINLLKQDILQNLGDYVRVQFGEV